MIAPPHKASRPRHASAPDAAASEAIAASASPCIAPARDGRASGETLAAARHRPLAARLERTARPAIPDRRHHAGDLRQVRPRLVGSRSSSGRQAIRPCVYGCSGSVSTSRQAPCSTMRPPYITTMRSAISDTAPMSCVIISTAVRAALFAQQVEDLRLHGHVQRRGRLVGDQHGRIAGQRDGDHHALAHAARHLVRIIIHAPLRRGYAHRAQHLDGARPRPALSGPGAAAAARRSARPPCRPDSARSSAPGRSGNAVAAHLPHRALVARGQVLAAQQHAAAADASARAPAA